MAERTNPETRIAWERGRQAAIGIGLVDSEYSPMLTLAAFAPAALVLGARSLAEALSAHPHL